MSREGQGGVPHSSPWVLAAGSRGTCRLGAVATLVMLGAAGCSDSDDPNNTAAAGAGNYVGAPTAGVSGAAGTMGLAGAAPLAGAPTDVAGMAGTGAAGSPAAGMANVTAGAVGDVAGMAGATLAGAGAAGDVAGMAGATTMAGAGAAGDVAGMAGAETAGTATDQAGAAGAETAGAGMDETAGAGMDPDPVTGTITESGGTVELTLGELKMVVDGDFGGRIIEFSLAGDNVLYQDPSPGDFDASGATFWPSPQNWGWPPPTELDEDRYTIGTVTDTSATMASGAVTTTEPNDPLSGLTLAKSFAFSADGLGIDVTYQMDGNTSYAPWQISRVRGGISFFESVGTPVLDCLDGVQKMGNYSWYEFPAGRGATSCEAGSNPKINQDGTGWLANVDTSLRLLVIQSFPDIAANQFAEGEAEVELYASPDKGYVELEAQGAFAEVGTPWTITWYLVPVPAEVDISVGSQGLLDLVNATLGR